MTPRTLLLAGLLFTVFPFSISGQVKPDSTKTQIVFLGTGTPFPDPEKSGPSLAIVVNGASYIVDAGPGLVRRAASATKNGVRGLEQKNLKRVFITHLHSDHTLGLPDLMYTPWVMGRTEPLEVYGPPGIASMVHHLVEAYAEDNTIRIAAANKPSNRINAHEITAGVVYRDNNVTVTAFPVQHGLWKYAFGYHFKTADRTIVVSGDTRPSDNVSSACNGCDVLVHEAYAEKGFENLNADRKNYFRTFHTSTRELGAIATEAWPGLLILTHQMFFARGKENEQSMLAELREYYKGKVASAHDLDIF